MKKLKVAIIGTGAIGSMFGVFFAQAGEEVCMIDVREDLIREMDKNGGLLLETPEKTEVIPMLSALSSDDAAKKLGGPADLIVIFVKGYSTDVVMKSASALIGKETYVYTSQNGLGNEEVIAKYVDRKHIIFGTTALSSSVETVGTVKYEPKPQWNTHIMPLEGEMNAMCEQVAASLTKGGHNTTATMQTIDFIWKKVCMNCAANSVSAITRLKSNTIFTNDNGKALAEQIMREVCAVAQAKGIKLAYEDMGPNLEMSANLPWYPSMGLDSIHHRRTEIDTLNASIVRMGKELGVATPVNNAIALLVKLVEENYDALPEQGL